MPYVNHLAVIDHETCTRCPVCVRVCPTNAIRLDRSDAKPKVLIDEAQCLDCTICMTRCPEHAITMVDRREPLRFGVDWTQADATRVAEICRGAHMHLEQIICFCRQVQAREVAAAIELGHRTPEALARETGIRTGCGTLCVTSIMRLLKAAGVDVQKAPGWQWYGTYITIWDLPPEVQSKYPEYFVREDLEEMNKLFPSEG